MKISDQDFKVLTSYIYKIAGIHLSEKKKILVETRLSKAVLEEGYQDFHEYVKAVTKDVDGKLVRELVNKITTNHTYFYREKEHFIYLEKVILPELYHRHQRKKDIKIWSAGCSSGEEPYTLAMMLADFFSTKKEQWDTRILATDINKKVLLQGLAGIYNEDALDKAPSSWKKKYFESRGGKLQIKPNLRDQVIYKRLNLMDPFPMKRPIDIIFCRNVMIYFDDVSKKKILTKFFHALSPGGYLIIGHTETIKDMEGLFSFVQPSIYRKEQST